MGITRSKPAPEDIITCEPIPIRWRVMVGGRLYDGRSITKWAHECIARGRPITIPHNNLNMTQMDLNEINALLYKRGMFQHHIPALPTMSELAKLELTIVINRSDNTLETIPKLTEQEKRVLTSVILLSTSETVGRIPTHRICVLDLPHYPQHLTPPTINLPPTWHVVLTGSR